MEIVGLLINKIIIAFPGVNPDQLKDILSSYDIQEKSCDGGKDLETKIDLFISAKRIQGLSKNTLKSYSLELAIFRKNVTKETEKINTGDLRAYLGKFPELKISSLTNKLQILKSFFGWLTDEEIIPRDPARKIKPPKKEKRIPKAMSIDELETIRESCVTVRERALVEVFYATRARLSEVEQMDRDKVNYNERSIRVVGKGDKERTVYFSEKAMRFLRKYMLTRADGNPALFVTQRAPHNRLGIRSLEKEIEKIATRSGIQKHIHPHIFRHTLATLMLNNGADLTEVQNILGHEDPATTQIYAVLTEKRKQEAYRRYMVQ